MYTHPNPTPVPGFAAPESAAALRERLAALLQPLRTQLDAQIDQRLVRTFLATLEAVLRFRNRAHGLLLSELGAELLGPAHAPAGTKRLSNLLRSPKWSASLIAEFLWQQAQARVQEWRASGAEYLLIWDDSVLEKPESQKAEGLCPVRSSKAARLARRRQGFSGPPPARPIYVPGVRWLCLLLLGEQGPPVVAAMEWWSSRRETAPAPAPPPPEEAAPPSPTHQVRVALLRRCIRWLGRQGRHVFDRGFAGGPFLGELFALELQFVLRWPKGYHLVDQEGEKRAAGAIVRGQRSWEHRYLKDPRRGELRKVGVVAVPVTHPEYATPLWLVVARGIKKDPPWYLLTNEPVPDAEAAWRMVVRYARRWRIELTFRYTKSELAMESPRLWTWERRLKLLGLVTLAYAFLLSLLVPALLEWRQWLLRQYCHRTGRRAREGASPLYRLRAALSRLWLAHPSPPSLLQNPG
jgi:Transposase DDE domain